VKWGSSEGPQHLILGKLAGQPEISDFDFAVLEEDVGGFEISMDYLEFMHS